MQWESVGLMDGYYVVEVTTIPYPGFEVLINIVSKEDIAYRVRFGDIPQCTYFTKMSTQSLKWMSWKHFYYVFTFLCKVDYNNDKCTLQFTPIMRSCGYMNVHVS